MLLRRGGARDQGPELGPHQALLHCPHQRGWSADRPWNFLTMAIMNLGLSSKELGQLHLHSRNCKACFCVRNEIWYHIFMLSTPCSVGEHELYEILFSFHYNLDFGWSVNSCVLSRGKIKTSKLPNLSPTLDTAGHQQLEIGIVLSFPATWKNNNNVDKHF